MQAIRDTLEETPPELASDIARDGILLAGGGTLIRGFPELVAAETGMPVFRAESPLTCVAFGSGQALAISTSSAVGQPPRRPRPRLARGALQPATVARRSAARTRGSAQRPHGRHHRVLQAARGSTRRRPTRRPRRLGVRRRENGLRSVRTARSGDPDDPGADPGDAPAPPFQIRRRPRPARPCWPGRRPARCRRIASRCPA